MDELIKIEESEGRQAIYSAIADLFKRVTYRDDCSEKGTIKAIDDISMYFGKDEAFDKMYVSLRDYYHFTDIWLRNMEHIETNKKEYFEADIENKFCNHLKSNNKSSKRQVSTIFGRIDILTDDYIYEVKLCPSLSSIHKAIGQLSEYARAFPGRKLAIVSDRFPSKYNHPTIELITVDMNN